VEADGEEPNGECDGRGRDENSPRDGDGEEQSQGAEEGGERAKGGFGVAEGEGPGVEEEIEERRGGVGADEAEDFRGGIGDHPGGVSLVEPEALMSQSCEAKDDPDGDAKPD
jgi:hypothetical protein